MLHTIDGRKIRANKRITYVVAGVSPDGRYVYLDERHSDGRVLAGPTVTAAEWHHHQGNVWVSCPGSRRRPRSTDPSTGFYYGSGTCATCGNRVSLSTAGVTFGHKRPQGQSFVNGVQVFDAYRRNA
jgi:hypothetical protein